MVRDEAGDSGDVSDIGVMSPLGDFALYPASVFSTLEPDFGIVPPLLNEQGGLSQNPA